MDIKTLEALGVSLDDLGDRIVDQAVSVLLSASGFDQDSEQEIRYESKFKKAISDRIQKAVDEKIAALASEHLVPRVGELIEKADMRITNNYGEPKGPSLTFKEYIALRAESYMTENVDYWGNSKFELEANGKSTYDWKSVGPRLTVLMKLHIREEMEKAAKAAMNDVNKVIAKTIEQAARDAIESAANAIKVSVSN